MSANLALAVREPGVILLGVIILMVLKTGIAHRQGEVGRHPHRHEEEAEQQALEGLHVRLQLMPIFRLRQDHPRGEGAQRQRQAGSAGQGRGADHHQEGRAGEQLARLGSADGAEQGAQ